MKKIITLLLLLIGFNLANFNTSYAGIFSDSFNVDLNEVDSFSNVVIFIKFNDEASYTAPYDYNYYENMFNGIDVVSLRDYYLEVSYDKLTIESYIVNDNSQIIYYMDTYNRNYYEPYDETTNPDGYDTSAERTLREHALLKAAIDHVEVNNLIDDSIILDSNGDGDIDSITFMISGEDNGWSSLFWPHKWSLNSYYDFYLGEYKSNAPTINGSYAYSYTFELLGNSVSYDRLVDAGVLSHETFHLISAPDLYHYYEYLNIEPIGDWGLMGSTSDIPSHMLGYMKEYYGNWIDNVTEITSNGTYTLYPLRESEDNLYKINLDYSNEYIYIEYRDNVGLYESNLPDSGLIVYRVDFDFYDEGNVYGYYNDFDIAQDEVFIFRPGIPDTVAPITFPDTDANNVDEDGDIDLAALSNYNAYDEMGSGTDILMFYSDGELINIVISNVVEHEGYITFDISFSTEIKLDIDEELLEGTTLYLIDDEIYQYNFSITNLPSTNNVYYTLDGSLPTTSDTLYEGGLIPFSVTENVITIAEYDGETMISSSSEEFTFVDGIWTGHNPYGDNENVSWYLDFKYEETEYDLTFSDISFLEAGYDYVHIIDDGVSVSYTGHDMRYEELKYTGDNLLINLESDSYLSDYFGFIIDIEVTNYININLNGNDYIEVGLNEIYIEQDAYLSGMDTEFYTILIEGVIDTSVIGLQTITYSILDSEGLVIDSIYREVNIIDNLAPIVTLIGDEIVTVNYLDDYTELGISYTDNLSEDLDYVISGSVDTSVLGEYILEYTVTDSYGNVSSVVTRTVNVVDTVDPLVELVSSLDTIFVGDEYKEYSVYTSDNHTGDLDIEIISNVDVSTAGEYIVEYIVTDESGNYTSIKRYVNVIEKEVVKEFICEAGISTFRVNDDITPPKCYVEGELAIVSYSVEIGNAVGPIEITYSVIIDEVTYQKVSYIYISQKSNDFINYYERKRRYTL